MTQQLKIKSVVKPRLTLPISMDERLFKGPRFGMIMDPLRRLFWGAKVAHVVAMPHRKHGCNGLR